MRKHFFNHEEKGFFKEERSGPNPLAMGGNGACIIIIYIHTVHVIMLLS